MNSPPNATPNTRLISIPPLKWTEVAARFAFEFFELYLFANETPTALSALSIFKKDCEFRRGQKNGFQ
jgi:hypothetical protein